MKTPEELAKETLQKKLKFSPDTWTDCHTCFVYGYDAALQAITDCVNEANAEIAKWFIERIVSQFKAE